MQVVAEVHAYEATRAAAREAKRLRLIAAEVAYTNATALPCGAWPTPHQLTAAVWILHRDCSCKPLPSLCAQ